MERSRERSESHIWSDNFCLAQKNIFQSADWTWGSLCVLPVMFVSVRGLPPGTAASSHSPENKEKSMAVWLDTGRICILYCKRATIYLFILYRESICCVEQKSYRISGSRHKVEGVQKLNGQIHKVIVQLLRQKIASVFWVAVYECSRCC